MKHFWYLLVIVLLIQSCTAAAFDKAQPTKEKPLTSFPKELHGAWESTEESAVFYVDKVAFDDSTVTYEMSSLAPDSPQTMYLKPDSIEIRKLDKDFVFSISGDGLWLNYIIKRPNPNELVVYGFDEDAKNFVKQYEEEDTEEGIVFIKYKATEKEWKKLIKSSALKKMRTFKRVN